MNLVIPGHAVILHTSVSSCTSAYVPFPVTQLEPPIDGIGLEHVRTRLISPTPQETEHCVHDDQDAQLPFTEKSIQLASYDKFINKIFLLT